MGQNKHYSVATRHPVTINYINFSWNAALKNDPQWICPIHVVAESKHLAAIERVNMLSPKYVSNFSGLLHVIELCPKKWNLDLLDEKVNGHKSNKYWDQRRSIENYHLSIIDNNDTKNCFTWIIESANNRVVVPFPSYND